MYDNIDSFWDMQQKESKIVLLLNENDIFCRDSFLLSTFKW